MMRTGWMLLGLLVLSAAALAEEGRSGAGRYEALPLAGTEGGQGGGRAFILDTRDGHVWIWSENELVPHLMAVAAMAPALSIRANCAPAPSLVKSSSNRADNPPRCA